MSTVRLLLSVSICTFCLSAAQAHENLVQPPLRDGTNQKIRPCGGVAWGTHVTSLQPGATLFLQWVETIHHPGWFRISFRTSESGDFNDMILEPKVESLTGIDDYSKTITLPNVTTEQGSVQLSFVMTDQPNNTMPYGYNEYSNCTDIVLTTNPNAPDASLSPTPGPSPSSPATDTPTEGASPSPSPQASYVFIPDPLTPDTGGGCATSATSALGWLLCALVARRRRRSGN